MAKKPTRLQKEYAKEIRRLKKGFYRYKKQGYYFPEESVDISPARVTQKMLQNIKEIKPAQLRDIASKVDTETGEITKQSIKKPLQKIKQIKPKRVSTKVKTLKPPKQPKDTIQRTPEIFDTDKLVEQIQDWHDKNDTQEQEEEYIPNLTIVDSIRDRIAELPDVNRSPRGGIPIGGRRNGLLAIFEDNLYSKEGQELADYIDYLLQNQGTLLSELTSITYESDDIKLNNEFGHAGEILNGGHVLSPSQSEMISIMQEYY